MATHSNILARRIPINRGAWQVTAHGVKESDITERLSLSLVHTEATVHSKQLLQRVKLGQRAGSDTKNAHQALQRSEDLHRKNPTGSTHNSICLASCSVLLQSWQYHVSSWQETDPLKMGIKTKKHKKTRFVKGERSDDLFGPKNLITLHGSFSLLSPGNYQDTEPDREKD